MEKTVDGLRFLEFATARFWIRSVKREIHLFKPVGSYYRFYRFRLIFHSRHPGGKYKTISLHSIQSESRRHKLTVPDTSPYSRLP